MGSPPPANFAMDWDLRLCGYWTRDDAVSLNMLVSRRTVSQGEMVLKAGRPIVKRTGPTSEQVNVERPFWGPHPNAIQNSIENSIWTLGARFLHDFTAEILGQRIAKFQQVSKADRKPPEWGDVMKMFESSEPPARQLATWESLIDRFVTNLLPAKTAEDAARVWALQTSLMSTIEKRVQAIHSPAAWDQYFHTMPPSAQHSMEWQQAHGAQFITKMTAQAKQTALDVLINARMAGEGPKHVQQVLMERMGELNRDWRRIAITETAMAVESGKLAAVADSGEWEAVWIAGPRACPACRKMFGRTFQIVSKFQPGMDPEKIIAPGRSNIGRSPSLYRRDGSKRSSEELWIPCIPLHPNCCCLWSIRRKLTNKAGIEARKMLAELRQKRYASIG